MKIIEKNNKEIIIRISILDAFKKTRHIFYQCPKNMLHKNISMKGSDKNNIPYKLVKFKCITISTDTSLNFPEAFQYNYTKPSIEYVETFSVTKCEYNKLQKFLKSIQIPKINKPKLNKINTKTIPKPKLNQFSNPILGLQLE